MTKSITVPVDLGMGTLPVLDAALELARGLDARIDLVHVREPAPRMLPLEKTSSPTPIDGREEQRLDAVARPILRRGIDVSSRIRSGMPDREIVQHAEELQADYIVLGCHKKGVLERALLGSVSQAVLQRAPCSVVLVDVNADLDADAENPRQEASA